MKKVVKKQLKEDEFVSTMTKIFEFVKKRRREIIIIAAAGVFFILLYAGLRFLQAQNIKKESELLSRMLELRAELSQNPAKLAELKQTAGRGKFARLAFVLEATHWMERGELEKAKEALATLKPEPRDFIYYQAQDLLGQINLLQKNYGQAVAIYQKLEEAEPEEYGLDVILFHKAEALEGKGDREAALALYKDIQKKYPQSYYSFDASDRVRKIESATPPSL
jgi:predicted negative regulator of RcsB-dependent stress response